MTTFSSEHQTALVLHPILKSAQRSEDAAAKLEEAQGLAEAIGLKVLQADIVSIPQIRPATFIGTGKVEEYEHVISAQGISLAIINNKLSPVQQRNLEKAWKCKVIDRTALILEIFGARARTSEGKLQVELAALEYQKSRLVRSWTHLERQRGGFGFLGGPGETQIEADRRIISEQITKIKKELETVTRTRELHRKSRRQVPYPIIALVGYTNAGKSTLFNNLTGADVFAENQLFATLDPTMRMVTLPSRKKIILSDTVGFISDLPTELIAAFRATLEEVAEADIMIHVRDIAHPDTEQQKKDVHAVLTNLNLEDRIDSNTIEVFNKIDKLTAEAQKELTASLATSRNKVAISALLGIGKEQLLYLIDQKLAEEERIRKVALPISEGKTLAWIYEHADILAREDNEQTIHLTIRVSDQNSERLNKMLSL